MTINAVRTPGQAASRQGVLLAVGSMVCVQLGLASSVGVVEQIGPADTAALRLMWAGVILLALVRRRVTTLTRKGLWISVELGLATAGSGLLFMAAVARIPLGTASALEFMGPLGIAITHGRGNLRRVWPATAALGVLFLTEPWNGAADPVGVGCALGAGAFWAAYILLTQRVGDEVAGIVGLAVSLPVAGLVATLVAILVPNSGYPGAIPPQFWLAGLGLAVLLPLVPSTLELLALRRVNAAAYGTLMCLEPALALLIGLVLLAQIPRTSSVVGVLLVVTAGVGAERTGSRTGSEPDVHVAGG